MAGEKTAFALFLDSKAKKQSLYPCSHRNWFHISAGLFVFSLHLTTQTSALAAKTGITESLRSVGRYFAFKGLWSKTKSSLS